MNIQDRVFRAIDVASKGDFAQALDAICPAIEATTRKHYKKRSTNRDDYVRFLREHYWLIERMVGEGLNLKETTFPVVYVVSDQGKPVQDPDFAQIV